MSYTDEYLLMLSGIQHMAFCERQWALIHIEQQWAENMHTVEGHHLHERVDDPFASETRKDCIILRAVPLVSQRLGFTGKADVLEFILSQDDDGIILPGHTGKWLPRPVEYKRGRPKSDERDEVQLCAQAMCLEEMYGIGVEKGFFYYGETHHRCEVMFAAALRQQVEKYAKRMHELFENGLTPLPVYKSHCKSCSLADICVPKSMQNQKNVNEYLKSKLE